MAASLVVMTLDQTASMWDAGRVTARLVTPNVITHFRAFDSVDSTNRVVAAEAKGRAQGQVDAGTATGSGPLNDLTLVVADTQTHGRGRLDRQWESRRGESILASMWLACRDVPKAQQHQVTLMLGVSVCSALRILGVDAAVKWPNDVLVRGSHPGKICGVLAEAVPQAGGVVLGFGLNVSTPADSLPEGAASLHTSGIDVDREDVLCLVLEHFAAKYKQWCAVQGDPAQIGLWTDLKRCCCTLGMEIRADLPGGKRLVGTAVDVDAAGSLVVACEDRSLVAVSAGDVIHVRPQTG